MGQIAAELDAQTFAESAEAQKRLIQTAGLDPGAMALERWQQLVRQLVDLKVIEKPIDPRAVFFELSQTK